MNELAKLKDIKPLVKIPVSQTHHFDYMIFIILFLVLVLAVILILFIRKHYKIKKEKEELLSLINNPKKFAYEFKKAKKFINSKNKELFEEIQKRLTNYKYKKEVNPIDEETKKLIKEFLK